MKDSLDWLVIMPQDRLHGSEQLLMSLTTELTKKGDKCMVMFLKKKNFGDWEHLEDSCEIHYGRTNNVFLGYLLLLPRLIITFNRTRFKRTFTSQTLINSMMGFLKKIRIISQTKVIVRESNSIFRLLKGLKLWRYIMAYKIGYGGVDLIICQTDFMKAQLTEAMPWMKKKLRIIVLPNPIDLDMIRIKEMESLSIEWLNKNYIVGAGRLVPIKGFDVLIKSFKNLLNEFPNLYLVILGEGPERKALEDLAFNLDIRDRVRLVGHVPNVYPYFRHAELCVLSSRVEGFPNVLLQMMSQNTNVVSTLSAGDIEQLPGVITCESDSVIALESAMKKCIKAKTEKNRALIDQDLKRRTVSFFLESTLSSLDDSGVIQLN